MSSWINTRRVVKVETPISFSDGSAISYSTNDDAVIDNVTVSHDHIEQDGSPWDPGWVRRHHRLTGMSISLGGYDLKYTTQLHNSPEVQDER